MGHEVQVEVVLTTTDKQIIMPLYMPPQSTIRDALHTSKLVADIDQLKVGIFGRLRSLDFPLQEGDRVEIYRNIHMDPKLARTQRVEKERRDERKRMQKIYEAAKSTS